MAGSSVQEVRDNAQQAVSGGQASMRIGAGPYRRAVVATDEEGHRRALQAIIEDVQPPRPRAVHPRVAFLFPGQGGQYPGMGKTLFDCEPVFRQALRDCAALVDPLLERPLLSVMFDGDRVHDTRWTQPASVALQVALVELWRAYGVRPDAVLGHSLGEYSAAWCAGVLSTADLLQVAVDRGRQMYDLPQSGSMVAVLCHVDRVRPLLPSAVAIAAINAPESVVISGAVKPIQQAVSRLGALGIETRRLEIGQASHAEVVDPMLDAWQARMHEVRTAVPNMPLYGNLDGRAWTKAPDGVYWRDHLRQTVQFQAGLRSLTATGITTFVEIGPRSTLCGLGRHTVATGSWITSLHPGSKVFLSGLAALWRLGVPVLAQARTPLIAS